MKPEHQSHREIAKCANCHYNGRHSMVDYCAPPNRNTEIREILADLESLKTDDKWGQAARLNIDLFRAIRHPPTYLWWLISRAPQLRRDRSLITEIGDLPLPRWQKAGLEMLSGFEAMAPEMLRPVKITLLDQLRELETHATRPVLMLSLGCGGMELERQIIYELIRSRSRVPVTFVGVDYAPIVPEIVAARFGPLLSRGLIRLETSSRVDLDEVGRLKNGEHSGQFRILILNTDAFELARLPADFFDCAYHTRMAHHLTRQEHESLNRLALHLAPRLFEFDDLFSVRTLLLASVFAWRFPAGFGCVVLSYLRDLSRRELLSENTDQARIEIAYGKSIRCYVKECRKDSP